MNIVKGRYLILRELFPENEFYIRELATEIEIDDSNLSRYVMRLEEEGLVSTRKVTRKRGKPLKYVKLTALGRNIIHSIIEAAKTLKEQLNPADPDNLEFYLNRMSPDENEDIRQIASEELVIICRNYDVISDDKVVSFLKKAMRDPDYKQILPNLLHALLGIIRNTGNEKTHKRIRSNLKKTLKDLIGQPSETSPEREARIRYTSLEVLTALSDGEETYTELVGLLRSLIEEAAPFAHAARHLILSKHPDKKNEMRRTLFKMLANPDEDLKRRVEDHIRELRKSPPARATR